MEIKISGQIGLIESFAALFNTQVSSDGKVVIPAAYGSGFIQGFNFNSSLRMIIRDYELKNDLTIKRNFVAAPSDMVIVSFQNLAFPNTPSSTPAAVQPKLLPSVQVYSGRFDSDIFYPSRTKFKAIVISIEIAYLKELIKEDGDNRILNLVTKRDHPFLFEEIIPPSIHKVAGEMVTNTMPAALNNFYCKIKAEELICLLFAELFKREDVPQTVINTNDIRVLYALRDSILAKLHEPPNLDLLARQANFSKSKLTRLFRQIFGVSIFTYYQAFRMQEAARLLKERVLTVSEIGHSLGFSNLSHFSRTFEEHFKITPKKYSTTA